MSGWGRWAGWLVAWVALSLAGVGAAGLALGVPVWRLPELHVPELHMPEWKLPAFNVPDARQAEDAAPPAAAGGQPASAPADARPVLRIGATPGAGMTALSTVLDVDEVPADAAGRAAYRRWLTFNLPRVFAIGSGGNGWAAGGGRTSLDEVRVKALDRCAAAGGRSCSAYAENLSVVAPGRQWNPPTAPGPLVATPTYALVPDERFIWRGPGTARGVYVWGHGYNGPLVDVRGLQPQPHVRPFNNAGFDIVRFDRDPMTDDRDRAAGWLRDGLQQLRDAGYRTVIVGGQSRGAWNALQMLDTPGLADAVIAVSPAAHGQGPGNRQRVQVGELRSIMDHMVPTETRLAMVQFADDTFAADPEWRAEIVELNSFHLGGVLLIDRPEGLVGHGAGETYGFEDRFAACLLRFALGGPANCPGASR